MKQRYLHFLLCCLAITLSIFAFLCFLDIVLPHPQPETRDFDFEGDFRLYSIEEYHNFVNGNTVLPDNFVTADMLSFLGKFKEIWFYDDHNLNNYRYTLINSFGRKILFTVYEEPWNHIEEISTSENGQIIFDFNDSKFRYLDSGMFRYIYHGNSLYWIEWTANGVWYQINAEAFTDPPLYGLSYRNLEKQQTALDLFPESVGNADLLAIADIKANMNITIVRLFVFVLVTAASTVSWHFVKVKRPVWYKEGMKL